MKRYKVREIIKMLNKEGWYLDRQRGSHRQFKHPTKPRTVTVPGDLDDIPPQGTQISIAKQAGWK